MMSVPAQPKLYHIVHLDRLPSILADGGLLSDAEVAARSRGGTTIGMRSIKLRRMEVSALSSHPGLRVGDCVPFYFCPRSVMLYLIHMANHPELEYRGGQDPVVHLEADLRATVAWASRQGLRWAFTLSNAGSSYFEDRADLAQLAEIDWAAVHARDWRGCKEGKQAELLVERRFPWELVERIGVRSQAARGRVLAVLGAAAHRPRVEVRDDWYY
jgi:hypothetical protein